MAPTLLADAPACGRAGREGSRGTCRSQVPAPSAVPRLSRRGEGRGGEGAWQAWLDRRGPHTLGRSRVHLKAHGLT